jgi:hypothetical protein
VTEPSSDSRAAAETPAIPPPIMMKSIMCFWA